MSLITGLHNLEKINYRFSHPWQKMESILVDQQERLAFLHLARSDPAAPLHAPQLLFPSATFWCPLRSFNRKEMLTHQGLHPATAQARAVRHQVGLSRVRKTKVFVLGSTKRLLVESRAWDKVCKVLSSAYARDLNVTFIRMVAEEN